MAIGFFNLEFNSLDTYTGDIEQITLEKGQPSQEEILARTALDLAMDKQVVSNAIPGDIVEVSLTDLGGAETDITDVNMSIRSIGHSGLLLIDLDAGDGNDLTAYFQVCS